MVEKASYLGERWRRKVTWWEEVEKASYPAGRGDEGKPPDWERWRRQVTWLEKMEKARYWRG